jgi:prevent-host-death family protein
MDIPAAVFKAECLQLMDEVARTGQPVVITKHGKPVAQLVPIPAQPRSIFGYMKNMVRINADVVALSIKNGAHCPATRIIYLPRHRRNREHVVAAAINECIASRYSHLALVRRRHYRSTAAGERKETGCGSH